MRPADAGPRNRAIDALNLPADPLGAYLTAPHPVAAAAALAFVLFWARAGAPLRLGQPGAWFGVLLGAAAYPFAHVWLRDIPTQAVLDVLRDNVGADALANATALTSLAAAIVAAYADEAAKLLMLAAVMLAMRWPSDPRAITAAAIGPAAGYVLFDAQLQLTQALDAGGGWEALLFPFVQAWAWAALQFGTAYLLARGWMTGRLAAYVLGAGVLHTGAVYLSTLTTLGWHPGIATLGLAAVGLLAFSWGASVIPASRR